LSHFTLLDNNIFTREREKEGDWEEGREGECVIKKTQEIVFFFCEPDILFPQLQRLIA